MVNTKIQNDNIIIIIIVDSASARPDPWGRGQDLRGPTSVMVRAPLFLTKPATIFCDQGDLMHSKFNSLTQIDLMDSGEARWQSG